MRFSVAVFQIVLFEIVILHGELHLATLDNGSDDHLNEQFLENDTAFFGLAKGQHMSNGLSRMILLHDEVKQVHLRLFKIHIVGQLSLVLVLAGSIVELNDGGCQGVADDGKRWRSSVEGDHIGHWAEAVDESSNQLGKFLKIKFR